MEIIRRLARYVMWTRHGGSLILAPDRWFVVYLNGSVPPNRNMALVRVGGPIMRHGDTYAEAILSKLSLDDDEK